MRTLKEERLLAIKAFCKFIDDYNGEMTIINGQIFNSSNELIYSFKL